MLGLSKIIGVYAGSKVGRSPEIAEFAQAAGTVLGRHAEEIVIGGVDCGLMQVVAEAAAQAENDDGERAVINAYVAEQWASGIRKSIYPHVRQHVVKDDAARDVEFSRADTLVAFPGSAGTMREIFETANAIAYLGCEARLVVANAGGFYTPLRDLFQNAHDEGFNSDTLNGRILFADTPEGLQAAIWLENNL